MKIVKTKKQKKQKKCVTKRELKLEDYKSCLEPAQTERKLMQIVLKKIKKNL